eukprot:scaffold22835_cov19-Prasinocladus_malaysianus.AAC.1
MLSKKDIGRARNGTLWSNICACTHKAYMATQEMRNAKVNKLCKRWRDPLLLLCSHIIYFSSEQLQQSSPATDCGNH